MERDTEIQTCQERHREGESSPDLLIPSDHSSIVMSSLMLLVFYSDIIGL